MKERGEKQKQKQKHIKDILEKQAKVGETHIHEDTADSRINRLEEAEGGDVNYSDTDCKLAESEA